MQSEVPIPFIVVHIIPAIDWNQYSYRRKKGYHFLITTLGKKIALKQLFLPLAGIDVAYIGTHREARNSAALYTLLQDLWAAYPSTEIVYADELQERTRTSPFILAARSVIQHLPGWFQRLLPICNSLFTLRTLLPLI